MVASKSLLKVVLGVSERHLNEGVGNGTPRSLEGVGYRPARERIPDALVVPD